MCICTLHITCCSVPYLFLFIHNLTPSGYTTVWKEGKVIPVHNYLSAKPRRHGGMEVGLKVLLTLVLVEGEWSPSPPGRFNHPILIRLVCLSGQHGRQKILDLSRTHYTPALYSAYM
jgi:hypothetical protein